MTSHPDYRHVRNLYLRRALEGDPSTVTDAKLVMALIATCASIIADRSSQDVSSPALEVRVRNHHRAERAFMRGDWSTAVDTLPTISADYNITHKLDRISPSLVELI